MTRFAAVTGGRESVSCSHCGHQPLYMPPSGLCESCGCQSLVVDEAREAVRTLQESQCRGTRAGVEWLWRCSPKPVARLIFNAPTTQRTYGLDAYSDPPWQEGVTQSIPITVDFNPVPELIRRRTPKRPPTCDMPGCEMDAVGWGNKPSGMCCEDHLKATRAPAAEFQIETVTEWCGDCVRRPGCFTVSIPCEAHA